MDTEAVFCQVLQLLEGRWSVMNDRECTENRQGNKTAGALLEFTETVARLMAPDGCPWDRVQTHESLKAACIEEAAEVVCGINILHNTGKAESLCEELGDLLLQVVMHAQIAEKEGLFTLEDVIRGINEKMIRRHPHIFGKAPGNQDSVSQKEGQAGVQVPAEQIHADWKEIKAREKLGREWEEPYLFEAFAEAESLIDVARNRKLRAKPKHDRDS